MTEAAAERHCFGPLRVRLMALRDEPGYAQARATVAERVARFDYK